jgi:hypothetical protein
VGYGETACYIERTLQVRRALLREVTRMEAVDEALVVRFNYRPQDQGMKRGTPGFSDESWGMGLLERID